MSGHCKECGKALHDGYCHLCLDDFRMYVASKLSSDWRKHEKERDQLRGEIESLKAQLTPALRERDELFEQVTFLKSQLAAAQRAYDRALEQRDAANAEVARMKARPAEAEYECLDEVWQRMEKQRDEAFEQRDKAKAQLKRTRAAVKLVAAERDAAREEAARPSMWLLGEGNKLVRKFAAVKDLISHHGCECECTCLIVEDHDDTCERCLACRIEAVLKGKAEA